MKWAFTGIAFIALIVLLCAPWSGGKAGAINVVGSTSIQPFAEMLSQEFAKHQPGFAVDVQGGGSTVGLRAVANDMADIGMCSRELKNTPDESGLFTTVVIARDGLAIVVHPSNPLISLPKKTVEKIFAGEITRWNQLSGPDQPIRLITREEGSGTREAFQKLVMGHSRISRKALTQESNGSVKELVKHDPCAIGYMSLGLVGEELKALQIDGVPATGADVIANRYPLVRPFIFVTKGQPVEKARRFIDFVVSPQGQQLLEKEGLVAASSGGQRL